MCVKVKGRERQRDAKEGEKEERKKERKFVKGYARWLTKASLDHEQCDQIG